MLVFIASGWLLGLLLAPSLPALARGPLIAGACAVALLCVGRRLRLPLPVVALAAGLAVPPLPASPSIASGLYRIEASVLAARYRRDHESLLQVHWLQAIDAQAPEGDRGSRSFPRAYSPTLRLVGPLLAPGSRIRCLAHVRKARRFDNLSPHPPWPSPDRFDAFARLARGTEVEHLHRSSARELLERLRARVRRALKTTLSPTASGLAQALVLGDRGSLDEEREATIRQAGLAHVLAVSGLHVGLAAGMLFLLLRALFSVGLANFYWLYPSRWAAASCVPLTLVYALFAGGAPSAWRAALTASIAFGLIALGRRPRAIAVAAVAIALVAALAPREVRAPSFLLSVLATAAVLTTPRSDSRLRDALELSFRTTCATAPLVAWAFGELPVLGVLANLVLLPLAATLLVPLVNLHALLALVSIDVANLSGALFELVERAFVELCGFAAALPLGHDLPPPSVPQGIVVAMACALLLVARGWRRLGIAAGAAIVLLLLDADLVAQEQPRDRLRVSFLDVGQGDAALVDLPDGSAMLIDAGGGGGRPGERAIVPLLRARRRDRIAVFVLTHAHPDHYEGLADLLDAEIAIDEIWSNRQAAIEEPSGPAQTLLARARAAGSRVRAPNELCARPHRWGRAELSVLWPCPGYDPGYDFNDNSLVLRLRYGRRAFLFSGDIEGFAETSLVASSADLRADILKVPHHGSRTSSQAQWLRRVDPLWAVASNGRDNRYGHPHRVVVERYRDYGVELLNTAQRGGVLIETDGEAISIATARGEEMER